MQIKEVIDYLKELAKPESSLSWDNCGIQVGDLNANISKISVALTPTIEIIESAIKNQSNLLITHHPLIFKPLKFIDVDTVIGKSIHIAIKNELTIYSIHTSFDSAPTGLNYEIAKKLNLENISVFDELSNIGTIGSFTKPLKLKTVIENVKNILNLAHFTYVGDPEKAISKVAICTGSGGSFLSLVKEKSADLYITGDIKYHNAIDAKELDLALIDAGHHGTEILAVPFIANYISQKFDTLEVFELIERDPFNYI